MKVEAINGLAGYIYDAFHELGVDPYHIDNCDVSELPDKIEEALQAKYEEGYEAGVESLQAEIEQLKDEITSLRYDLQDATGRSY